MNQEIKINQRRKRRKNNTKENKKEKKRNKNRQSLKKELSNEKKSKIKRRLKKKKQVYEKRAKILTIVRSDHIFKPDGYKESRQFNQGVSSQEIEAVEKIINDCFMSLNQQNGIRNIDIIINNIEKLKSFRNPSSFLSKYFQKIEILLTFLTKKQNLKLVGKSALLLEKLSIQDNDDMARYVKKFSGKIFKFMKLYSKQPDIINSLLVILYNAQCDDSSISDDLSNQLFFNFMFSYVKQFSQINGKLNDKVLICIQKIALNYSFILEKIPPDVFKKTQEMALFLYSKTVIDDLPSLMIVQFIIDKYPNFFETNQKTFGNLIIKIKHCVKKQRNINTVINLMTSISTGKFQNTFDIFQWVVNDGILGVFYYIFTKNKMIHRNVLQMTDLIFALSSFAHYGEVAKAIFYFNDQKLFNFIKKSYEVSEITVRSEIAFLFCNIIDSLDYTARSAFINKTFVLKIEETLEFCINTPILCRMLEFILNIFRYTGYSKVRTLFLNKNLMNNIQKLGKRTSDENIIKFVIRINNMVGNNQNNQGFNQQSRQFQMNPRMNNPSFNMPNTNLGENKNFGNQRQTNRNLILPNNNVGSGNFGGNQRSTNRNFNLLNNNFGSGNFGGNQRPNNMNFILPNNNFGGNNNFNSDGQFQTGGTGFNAMNSNQNINNSESNKMED